MPQTAMLGLGGNLGDPRAAMSAALQRLDRHAGCRVTAVSPLYRTPPWGKTDQDPFLNACASLSTTLAPETLLDLCLDIERDMKRERAERWGPRTLDLDVLTYGDLRLATQRLELPHPRMLERGFVLKPLADIAPDLAVAGRSVRDWLAATDTAGIERIETGREWWRDERAS